jgi:hypothetical protein
MSDLSLTDRIFRHHLSYLVQFPVFLESPEGLKKWIYDRFWAILSPETPPDGYDYFDQGEREAIISILRATHSGLPGEWKKKLVAGRSGN